MVGWGVAISSDPCGDETGKTADHLLERSDDLTWGIAEFPSPESPRRYGHVATNRPARNGTLPLAGFLLVLAVSGALAGCSEKPEDSVPRSGATFEEAGPPEMRATADQAIMKLRQGDVRGLAELDMDPLTHERGGARAAAGAAWLVRNFSEPMAGEVSVRFKQSDVSGDLHWFACLTYGDPQQQLELGFVGYGRKGWWPDPEGIRGYYFPAGTYPTEGTPVYRKAHETNFCRKGALSGR